MTTTARGIRPSGLAVVGYGLTLVGFIQVAVTIAPYVASKLPEAGAAATVVGAAVALAIDVVWASLAHATTRLAQTRQWAATAGFGVATSVAVVASTLMLATVGHMGPWSLIPVLACVLLVADGIRGLVVVSDATGTAVRAMANQIRDDRAMARMRAQQAAHEETIRGFEESARLAARTASLAEIRTTVERAESRAHGLLRRSRRRHGDGADGYRELIGAEAPLTPAVVAPVAKSVAVSQGLSLVASQDSEVDEKIRDMVARNMKPAEIAEALSMHRATVYRRLKTMRSA